MPLPYGGAAWMRTKQMCAIPKGRSVLKVTDYADDKKLFVALHHFSESVVDYETDVKVRLAVGADPSAMNAATAWQIDATRLGNLRLAREEEEALAAAAATPEQVDAERKRREAADSQYT